MGLPGRAIACTNNDFLLLDGQFNPHKVRVCRFKCFKSRGQYIVGYIGPDPPTTLVFTVLSEYSLISWNFDLIVIY
jgi:hypothetical protein